MNNFCGARLSTVGVVVGWINFIGAILSSIFLIVLLIRLDEVIVVIKEQMTEVDEKANIRTAVTIALSIYLTVSLASVFASAMLIMGTVKERHLCMIPWLVNAYIFICINVLNFIYMVYMSISKNMPINSVIFGVITGALGLAIQCTIWSAIYSLFKKIRANRDMQQRLLPTSSHSLYTNYTKMPPAIY